MAAEKKPTSRGSCDVICPVCAKTCDNPCQVSALYTQCCNRCLDKLCADDHTTNRAEGTICTLPCTTPVTGVIDTIHDVSNQPAYSVAAISGTKNAHSRETAEPYSACAHDDELIDSAEYYDDSILVGQIECLLEAEIALRSGIQHLTTILKERNRLAETTYFLKDDLTLQHIEGKKRLTNQTYVQYNRMQQPVNSTSSKLRHIDELSAQATRDRMTIQQQKTQNAHLQSKFTEEICQLHGKNKKIADNERLLTELTTLLKKKDEEINHLKDELLWVSESYGKLNHESVSKDTEIALYQKLLAEKGNEMSVFLAELIAKYSDVEDHKAKLVANETEIKSLQKQLLTVIEMFQHQLQMNEDKLLAGMKRQEKKLNKLLSGV